MDYFGYLDGLTMTNAPLRRALRRPAAPAGVAASRGARWTSRASIQEVTEEIVLRMARHAARAHRQAQPLPGRRRGAQLRRQRPAAARRDLRRALDPARGRRRRRRARRARSPSGTTRSASRAPRRRRARRACRAALLGPEFSARPDPRVPRRRTAAPTRRSPTTEWAPRDRGAARRRRTWSACSRAAWSSARARSAAARSSATRARRSMQSVMNLKIKFRESFRPFAPVVLRGARRGLLRARPAVALHAAGAPRARASRRLAGADEERSADLASSGSTGRARTSRRSPTSTTRRASRPSTARRNPRYHALLAAFEAATGCARADQHQLQRARRADRLHAGGRLPLLHAHRDGLPGPRTLPARQAAPAAADSRPAATPTGAASSPSTRLQPMGRLGYAGSLLRDLVQFARQNKV